MSIHARSHLCLYTGAGIAAQGPGSSSAAAEALRVIRAAKLHRHGPPAQGPALIQAPASRYICRIHTGCQACLHWQHICLTDFCLLCHSKRLTHVEFTWGRHVVLCRLYAPEQNDAVRQHMQQMDAQIRQKVQQLQQRL